MTIEQAMLVIGVVSTAIATLIGSVVALLKARTNTTDIDELKLHVINDRKDIILIGEQLAGTRQDISKLVLLVNQLYIDYMNETGKKPKIDWEMFDQFMMVKHVTTPLGPLQVKE